MEPVFHGYDGYRRLWRYWLDAFEDIRWDPEEMLSLRLRRLPHAFRRGGASRFRSGEPVLKL